MSANGRSHSASPPSQLKVGKGGECGERRGFPTTPTPLKGGWGGGVGKPRGETGVGKGGDRFFAAVDVHLVEQGPQKSQSVCRNLALTGLPVDPSAQRVDP
jgi:hypothetical protein